MKGAINVLDAFENIRRAPRARVDAPHKPRLILPALVRVQQGEPRLVELTSTDGGGALRELSGPREMRRRRRDTGFR